MRNFGAVSPKFWNGNTGKALRSDRDAQVVACYLMTCPLSHQTGIYYLPILMLSHETGIPMEGACKALRRLEIERFSVYSAETEWVWVREMALWQIGEPSSDGDKRIIGVQNYYRDLPDLPFLADFFDRYVHVYRLSIRRENTKVLPSPLQGASIPHGSHTHTQEDTQKDIQEGGVGETKSTDPKPSELKAQARKVFEHWQLTWTHPGAKFDAKRQKRIESRLREGFTVEQLCNAISGFTHSPWHNGSDPKSNGVVYDGLQTLLRDAAQVEAGIGLFANPPKNSAKNGNGALPMLTPEQQEWAKLRDDAAGEGFRKPYRDETAQHYRDELAKYVKARQRGAMERLGAGDALKSMSK